MNRHKSCTGRRLLLPGLLAALLLTACGQPAEPVVEADAKQDADMTHVSVVLYTEQEAGIDPYPVRILVNADYVRFDDGYDESDFVLLDRHSRTLFSVVHEDRSVLEILNQPASESMPANIKATEEHSVDAEAPAIAGQQPVHYTYLANGKSCYQSISVSGLMDSTVAGLDEYASALGERQQANMESVPGAMRTPCFMSRYVYLPGRHFRHGLPVRIWDESGYASSLTDYREDEAVAAALFRIPDDYDTLLMGEQQPKQP